LTIEKNTPHADVLISIFARQPIVGQVKTRLIPALGAQGAMILYQELLNHTINTVVRADLSVIDLCITPESQPTFFTQHRESNSFSTTMQYGADLGQRMYYALMCALEKVNKVILIGTDCPFLSRVDLQQAINALDTYDMVFSPAYDGGYVLVGATKLDKCVFSAIDWGTPSVMAQTRQQLRQTNLSWHELAKQHDIDVPEDLVYLASLDMNNEFTYVLPSC
jgi:rSAM/selenodomain-associated transferase 1